MTELQVEEFLEGSARRFPEKTALVCGPHRLTYRDIDARCNRIAHALLHLGVRRGDRVAVYLENSVEAVLSIFAILKAGAVFLVINPSTKKDKLDYILNDCRARLVISEKRMTSDPRLVSVADLLSGNIETDCPPPKQCIDLDLAALIYTSGSTGESKGVMMTHLSVVSAATSITTYLENTSDDIILNVLPLSFDYGLYQVLMGFKSAATVVLERSFTYPKVILDRLLEEKVTGFPIIPTISAILLQMDLKRYDFSSLRYITNTAAALPTSHILQLRRLFPHVRLYSMYGLTECKRVSYLHPDQVGIRPDSVGKAMPNEEVYIVDDAGNRVDAGVVGELVVRGSNVMRGYWGKPEETEKVLKPGTIPGERVLYTGDLFRMDNEGYLYFVGRKDDIIKTRGEKVSPKEVENVICRLEGIAEAAIIGMPDPILGEAVRAIVRLRNGAQISEQDILRHCSLNLENSMVPKSVEIRDVLPRSDNGKIDKKALKAEREHSA